MIVVAGRRPRHLADRRQRHRHDRRQRHRLRLRRLPDRARLLHAPHRSSSRSASSSRCCSAARWPGISCRRPASPGRTTCSAGSAASSPRAADGRRRGRRTARARQRRAGRRTHPGGGAAHGERPSSAAVKRNRTRKRAVVRNPPTGSLPKGAPVLWVARPHTSVASLFAARPASWRQHMQRAAGGARAAAQPIPHPPRKSARIG